MLTVNTGTLAKCGCGGERKDDQDQSRRKPTGVFLDTSSLLASASLRAFLALGLFFFALTHRPCCCASSFGAFDVFFFAVFFVTVGGGGASVARAGEGCGRPGRRRRGLRDGAALHESVVVQAGETASEDGHGSACVHDPRVIHIRRTVLILGDEPVLGREEHIVPPRARIEEERIGIAGPGRDQPDTPTGVLIEDDTCTLAVGRRPATAHADRVILIHVIATVDIARHQRVGAGEEQAPRIVQVPRLMPGAERSRHLGPARDRGRQASDLPTGSSRVDRDPGFWYPSLSYWPTGLAPVGSHDAQSQPVRFRVIEVDLLVRLAAVRVTVVVSRQARCDMNAR